MPMPWSVLTRCHRTIPVREAMPAVQDLVLQAVLVTKKGARLCDSVEREAALFATQIGFTPIKLGAGSTIT
jgi:hypothetical protein